MTAALSDLSRTAGLVLAGGRSSRFGGDKALARFRGELLLDRAGRPLQALRAIAVSAKAESVIAAHAQQHGTPLVADDPALPDGPLTGILAGLDWANALGFSFLATAPCDAPVLPLDLVSMLLTRREGAPAAYAETVQGQHPLCAVWHCNLRTQLNAVLTAGRHPPVRAFLAEIGATAVRFDAPNAFVNANTRDILSDLEQSI